MTAYLAKAAVKASMRLNTKAIIANSISGDTIRAIAAYRGDNPIYAQVYDPMVMRTLALSFGVFSDYIPREEKGSAPHIQEAISRLVKEKRFNGQDLVTVLAGHYGAAHGASFIEISSAESMINRAC